MIAALRVFWNDDSGATTVDWVVLTGGAAALALVMITTMNGTTSSVADEMETVLTSVEVEEMAVLGQGNDN